MLKLNVPVAITLGMSHEFECLTNCTSTVTAKRIHSTCTLIIVLFDARREHFDEL